MRMEIGRYTSQGWCGSNRGSILVGAVIFLFITGAVGIAFLGVGAYEGELVEGELDDLRAFWKGEEAILRAIAHMNRDIQSGKTETSASDGLRATYRAEQVVPSRIVQYRLIARVFRTQEPDSAILYDTAIVQARTASSFFFLEDRANDVYYYTGDTIDGPVHTNTRFAIAGSPVFKGGLFECGHVDPGSPYWTTPMFSPNPVITVEPTWGADDYAIDAMAELVKEVPKTNHIVPPAGFAAEIELTGATYQLRFRNLEDGTRSTASSYPIPRSGGLFVHGDLRVSGTLSGELSLGARDNIVIVDDLVYQGSDPLTGKPASGTSGLLALIAGKNVVVDKPLTKNAKPEGIRINAVIVAADKSFEVKNPASKFLGTMYLWGSIAQVERGKIGAVMSGGRQVGYVKSWHYDTRLSRMVPAYVPPLKDSRTGRTPFDQIYWSYTWG